MQNLIYSFMMAKGSENRWIFPRFGQFFCHKVQGPKGFQAPVTRRGERSLKKLDLDIRSFLYELDSDEIVENRELSRLDEMKHFEDVQVNKSTRLEKDEPWEIQAKAGLKAMIRLTGNIASILILLISQSGVFRSILQEYIATLEHVES